LLVFFVVVFLTLEPMDQDQPDGHPLFFVPSVKALGELQKNYKNSHFYKGS